MIFSKASFDSPYGLIGRAGAASSIGRRSGGPKIAQVEEKTIRFTRVATMASSRFKPLEMLLRKYFDGSHMDSATRALAAKCITASGRMLESAVSIWFRSARSPWVNFARGSTARRWPSVRLSKTATSWSSSRSNSAQTLPMYPAPPTTRIFIRRNSGVPDPHVKRKRKQLRLFLLLSFFRVQAGDQLFLLLRFFLLPQTRDHLPDTAVFDARGEYFQALFLRAPLQDIDIDVADTPASHVETARLVKIDRVCAEECGPVIVNDVFFICVRDSKPGTEWETRPIGGRAHHLLAAKTTVERIVAFASLAVGIGGGAHIVHALFGGQV